MKHKYRTLVLNADYIPLTIVSWQRAIVLEMDGRAYMLDFYKCDKIRDGHGHCYPIPAVIASRKHIKRDYRFAPFCRKNILIRDSLTCQYCGNAFDPKQLTLDHVIPRSRWDKDRNGSPTIWENIVTCCLKCNGKKANKTCEQAKMYPITKPVRPPYGEMFLGLSPWKENIPHEWLPFLQNLPLFKGINQHVKQEAAV
jgi:5-methylcytosine-specific restriction endonuclease McrA